MSIMYPTKKDPLKYLENFFYNNSFTTHILRADFEKDEWYLKEEGCIIEPWGPGEDEFRRETFDEYCLDYFKNRLNFFNFIRENTLEQKSLSNSIEYLNKMVEMIIPNYIRQFSNIKSDYSQHVINYLHKLTNEVLTFKNELLESKNINSFTYLGNDYEIIKLYDVLVNNEVISCSKDVFLEAFSGNFIGRPLNIFWEHRPHKNHKVVSIQSIYYLVYLLQKNNKIKLYYDFNSPPNRPKMKILNGILSNTFSNPVTNKSLHSRQLSRCKLNLKFDSPSNKRLENILKEFLSIQNLPF
jgi:hypothetical protein